jgi:hypothetical protein
MHLHGTENHMTLEHQRDSPKVNIYCCNVTKPNLKPMFFCRQHCQWKYCRTGHCRNLQTMTTHSSFSNTEHLIFTGMFTNF